MMSKSGKGRQSMKNICVGRIRAWAGKGSSPSLTVACTHEAHLEDADAVCTWHGAARSPGVRRWFSFGVVRMARPRNIHFTPHGGRKSARHSPSKSVLIL